MKNCDLCEENIIHTESIESVKHKMISDGETLSQSEGFKALCDTTRIKILYALSINEMCVCDIADIIEMSQSAVSHQLRVLRTMRLVKYRKEGKSVFYSLNDQHVIDLFNRTGELPILLVGR